MTVIDVVLGLVLGCSAAAWVFFTMVIFQHDADSRACYIASVFAYVALVCLVVLAWRHLARRISNLSR